MVLILWFLALVAAGDVLAYLVGLLVEYQWGSYPSLVVFLAMYAVTLWVGQCQKVKRISCHILSVPILLGRYDLGRKGRHLAARSNRQPSVPDRMASPWRNDMAQNPAEGISAAIAATLAVTNCLVRFLDDRGLLQRAEFIAYLDQTASRIETEGANEALLQVFRANIETIRMDRIETTLN
jgi:hypothetical protein